MIEGAIAQRWARALLELAREENKIEEVRKELLGFAELLKGEKAHLASVLSSPSFSKNSKRGIVSELANAQGLSTVVSNFLKLAMDKDRGKYLLPIIGQYGRLADELTGIVHAKLTVAAEVSDDVRDKIGTTLEKVMKKKIQLDVDVDPAIVGGAVVKVGALEVDGSLRSQLRELAGELAQSE